MISPHPARFNPSSDPRTPPLVLRHYLFGSLSFCLYPLRTATASLTPVPATLPRNVAVAPLESTLAEAPISVDSKWLTGMLNALESTLMKNIEGWRVLWLTSHFPSLHCSSVPSNWFLSDESLRAAPFPF